MPSGEASRSAESDASRDAAATVARICAWCKGPIPAAARRDAVTCSKSCRQARHRFRASVGSAGATGVVAGHPRRIAYADPPYPGLSARYYAGHPDYAGEVDHAELVTRLASTYDAWALSTSADALQDVLAVCPPGVMVAAWVRGARPHQTAGRPLSSWEPVIYGGQVIRRPSTQDGSPGAHDASRGDRQRVAQILHDVSSSPADATRAAGATRRIDSLVHGVTARSTDPARVIGAKPAAFCGWLFRLLDAQPGDEFVDVFPGSGGVARAWDMFTTVARDA